jgi:hypothetical protein
VQAEGDPADPAADAQDEQAGRRLRLVGADGAQAGEDDGEGPGEADHRRHRAGHDGVAGAAVVRAVRRHGALADVRFGQDVRSRAISSKHAT